MDEKGTTSEIIKELTKGERRNQPPYYIWESIMHIPKILQDCLGDEVSLQLEKVVNEIKLRNIQRLFLIGTAAGYFASIAERYVFEQLANIPTEAVLISDFQAYPPLDLNSKTAVFFHSHSGGTKGDPDVVSLVKNRFGYTVGVTDIVGSPLANCVDDVIIGPGGPKPELPATRTYSSAIYRMVKLAIMLGKKTKNETNITSFQRKFEKIPGDINIYIEDYAEKSKEDSKILKDCKSFFVIGSGPNFATASEAAISISQSLGVPSQAFQLRNFLHGPIQTLRKDMCVVLIAAPGLLQDRFLLTAKACKTIGTKVVVLLPENYQPVDDYDVLIHLPDNCPELLSPLLYIMPLWQLAYRFSLLGKGCHPDRLSMDVPEFKKAIGILMKGDNKFAQ
jgi:glucosamine 6-phosphate synthetase-like amidotransferase/phosphosugar isomerase protein